MLIRVLAMFLAVPLAAQSFDATRVMSGKFDYTITDQGKEVATSSLSLRKVSPNRFTYSADATAVVCQHWESTADQGLRPVSALLRFCKDGNDRPMFELKYENSHVSGVRYSGKPPALEKRELSADIPSPTVDQRIDWVATMAQDLKPGMTFEFHVYDPGTGLSPLTGRVGQVELVKIPAGTFPAYHLTYQMNKQGKVEHYESWVSKDAPRILLKMRFPNGTLGELVKQTE